MRGRIRGRRGIVAGATLLLAATVALALAGDLDEAFGTGGVVHISLGDDPNWVEVDCAVRSDGRIALAGTEYQHWRIRGFHGDGSVDTGFGTDGSVTLFGGTSGNWLHDVALDGDGRILAAGEASVVTVTTNGKKTTQTTQSGAGLARITPDGRLDASFGSGGTVLTQVPGASVTIARSVAVQSDGKIVVAGVATLQTRRKGGWYLNPAIYLARYDANGSLDGTFGTNGITVHDRTGDADDPRGGAIGIQSDGRIVVGSRQDGAGWVVTRYLPSGAVDSGFGTVSSAGDRLFGLAVDNGDRIVAVGRREYGAGSADVLVVRYTPSGALDTAFGSGGATTVDLLPFEHLWCAPRFQADGKIVCSGIVFPVYTSTGYDAAYTDGIVLCLNDDGTRDDTFGTGGVTAPLHIVSKSNDPLALDLAPDGGIVVAGRTGEGPGTVHWFLARYLAE